MEIKGEKIIEKGKKIPKWIFVVYIICIITITGAIFSMNRRKTNNIPEAINFTTDGALGMKEGQYAYLDVQGLTEEIATYGDSENTSDTHNDRYCIAYNDGYWYVVDLDFETIDELKGIKEYTYSTDDDIQVPEAIRIYGMTEKIPEELKEMLIDYYNEGIEEENKINVDDFERYFGSALLNVRKSPINTTIEEIIIILAVIILIVMIIYNILIYIIKRKINKYLKVNNYKEELAEQLDDNVEEKHYKDKLILTKDFLVDLKSNGGFATFKYTDVKWIHIHSVKYYGVVTTSTSIIAHLKDGKTNIQCVKIKGGTTEEFLEIFNKICEKVPTDCLKGYTKENQEEFKEYKKEQRKKRELNRFFLQFVEIIKTRNEKTEF